MVECGNNSDMADPGYPPESELRVSLRGASYHGGHGKRGLVNDLIFFGLLGKYVCGGCFVDFRQRALGWPVTLSGANLGHEVVKVRSKLLLPKPDLERMLNRKQFPFMKPAKSAAPEAKETPLPRLKQAFQSRISTARPSQTSDYMSKMCA